MAGPAAKTPVCQICLGADDDASGAPLVRCRCCEWTNHLACLDRFLYYRSLRRQDTLGCCPHCGLLDRTTFPTLVRTPVPGLVAEIQAGGGRPDPPGTPLACALLCFRSGMSFVVWYQLLVLLVTWPSWAAVALTSGYTCGGFLAHLVAVHALLVWADATTVWERQAVRHVFRTALYVAATAGTMVEILVVLYLARNPDAPPAVLPDFVYAGWGCNLAAAAATMWTMQCT